MKQANTIPPKAAVTTLTTATLGAITLGEDTSI